LAEFHGWCTKACNLVDRPKAKGLRASIPRAGTAFVVTSPFRAPHQTISNVGLTGGRQVLLPGKVSPAHHGMLFLEARP